MGLGRPLGPREVAQLRLDPSVRSGVSWLPLGDWEGASRVDRKRFIQQAALVAALGPLATATASSSVPSRFADFCDRFYRRKQVRAAFEAHVAVDYRQHSPGIGQGREAALAVLEPMFGRPQFRIEPLRIIHDANLAIVLLDVQVGDAVRAMVVDIYRYEGDWIVEHWDVKGEIEAARREGYFDGLSAPSAGAPVSPA